MKRRSEKKIHDDKSASKSENTKPTRRLLSMKISLLLIVIGLAIIVMTIRLTSHGVRESQADTPQIATSEHKSDASAGLPSPDTSAMQPAVARSIRDAQEAIRREPHSGEAWGQLGMVFQAHALNAEASTAYERAAQLVPEDFRWPYLLAIVSENSGKSSKAIMTLYDTAVQREPNYAALHVRLGQLYLRSGKQEEAIRAFQTALTVDPDLSVAERALGRALMSAGRPREALQHLDRALRLSPNDGPTYASLARTLFQLGRRDRARAASENSRRLGPTMRLPDPVVAQVNARSTGSETNYMQALRHKNAGRMEQAAELFSHVASARPRDPYARIHLATCYVHLERFQEAEEHFVAASQYRAELDGAHKDTTGLPQTKQALDREFWAYLRARMIAALQAGDRKAVNSWQLRFEREAEHSSTDAHSHLIWGNVLMQEHNIKEAVVHYEAGAKLDPQNPNLLYNLGVGLERLGRQTEAIDSYRRAIQLDPNNRAGDRLRALGTQP